mmetsp:Transcript_11365/g.19158  ORF Transcript_11365/g.19158 Transcript_11365/m.19158 type:complete len:86 (-) Transcript_11365:72-329(-)
MGAQRIEVIKKDWFSTILFTGGFLSECNFRLVTQLQEGEVIAKVRTLSGELDSNAQNVFGPMPYMYFYNNAQLLGKIIEKIDPKQ